MDTIDRVRAFNRFYTRQIGLMAPSYLGSGLGLSEMNVLYELGTGQVRGLRDLAGTLRLDEGYLSRILNGFVQKGWLTKAPDEDDRRRTILTLTATGHEQAAMYVAQARSSVAGLLDKVPAAAQGQLVTAMADIEAALIAGPADISMRDLEIGDIGWLIQQHGEYYADHEGFDENFEALVAEILADYRRNHVPGRERAIIATQGQRRVGSIFCVRQDDQTAKLRLFYLVPEAQGLGLGKRLLTECLSFARGAGYRRMVLWTHKSHAAACALYAAFGFAMTDEEPVHEFGVDLVRQNWEISL